MIHELYKRPIWIRDNVLSDEQLTHLEQICYEHAEGITDYSDKHNPDIYKFGHSAKIYLNDDSRFDWMSNLLLSELRTYVQELGYNREFANKLYITNSWLGIYKEGDLIPQHVHRDSLWSLAFYIKNKTPTKLKFIHDMYNSAPYPEDYYLEWSKNTSSFDCTPNRVLIFSSYDCHGVDKIQRPEGVDDKDLKVMLSYNFQLARP